MPHCTGHQPGPEEYSAGSHSWWQVCCHFSLKPVTATSIVLLLKACSFVQA